MKQLKRPLINLKMPITLQLLLVQFTSPSLILNEIPSTFAILSSSFHWSFSDVNAIMIHNVALSPGCINRQPGKGVHVSADQADLVNNLLRSGGKWNQKLKLYASAPGPRILPNCVHSKRIMVWERLTYLQSVNACQQSSCMKAVASLCILCWSLSFHLPSLLFLIPINFVSF